MDDTLSIRAATQADLAGIDALLGRSYPALLKRAYPPSLLVTAIPLISKAQPRLVASGTYYVVLAGARIVGAGGWSRAAGIAAVGQVRHVVTDHRMVRQGIGRALMTHVQASARAAGLRRLECHATLMAVPFYAACGFREIGPITVSLRPGIDFPAVRMTRDL